ncbi:hypothetical protein GCM10009850_083860 [Nonomuraea monospora]|uniref:Uncharacterized protein n=1 Tax=Nonomuraea monospora TaxID=568818 RepID=A0ABN3CTX9_9ACTN
MRDLTGKAATITGTDAENGRPARCGFRCPAGRAARGCTAHHRERLPGHAAPPAYVCGSAAFVQHAADLLTDLGCLPDDIRTERYG